MMIDDKREYKENIFKDIETQIGKMDNKAGILISALGIVFALSIDLFSVFQIKDFNTFSNVYKVICYIMISFYCLSFAVAISMFVLTILPRKNKKQKNKNNENMHINYYYDLSEIVDTSNRSDKFKEYLEKEVKCVGLNLEYQIFTNADICRKKHDKLVIGIYSLIPFIVSMLGLIVLLIIGYSF